MSNAPLILIGFLVGWTFHVVFTVFKRDPVNPQAKVELEKCRTERDIYKKLAN